MKPIYHKQFLKWVLLKTYKRFVESFINSLVDTEWDIYMEIFPSQTEHFPTCVPNTTVTTNNKNSTLKLFMWILKYSVQNLETYKLKISKSALKINKFLLTDIHTHKFHLKPYFQYTESKFLHIYIYIWHAFLSPQSSLSYPKYSWLFSFPNIGAEYHQRKASTPETLQTTVIKQVSWNLRGHKTANIAKLRVLIFLLVECLASSL